MAVNEHVRDAAPRGRSERHAGSVKHRPELDRLYARVGLELRLWFARQPDARTLGGTRQAARPAVAARRDTAPSRALALMASASLFGALGAWLLSLGAIDTAAMTNYGLISVLPVSYFLAVVLVAVTLVFAQTRALAATPLPILALVMLVLLLHGTPAIVYDTLRYPWAWRHIGIIDLLLRDDGIDPADSKLLIYLDWPLFFVAFAKLSQLFDLGLHALAEIGRVFPVMTNLLFIPLLLGPFRRLSGDPRLAVRAMALLLVGNWIGQDYFSPQAVAFLFYLSIMALCLTFLGPRRIGSDRLARIPLVARARALFDDGRPVGVAVTPARRRVAALVAGLLIVALVATHQLTPILLLIALGGLFVMGRIGFALLLFGFVAEVVWFVFFADQTMSRIVAELASELGRIGQGTFGAMVDAGHVSNEQRVISFASRGLSGFIGLLALIGIYRRRRAGLRDGVPLVLVVAPILLIPMTSYGGEIVFRAYYFALPFLAFFAAAAFASAGQADPDLGPRGSAGFLLALIVGVLCFLLANNGKDRQYNIGADEVAAVEWLQTVGAPGALLIEGNINYPRQTRYPEKFFHLPLDAELPAIEEALQDDPAGLLAEWLAGWPGGGYILITRGQIAHDQALRLLPGGGLAELNDRLIASGAFCLLRNEPAARIFTLCPGDVPE